jgi:hypothetical protein
MVSRLLRITTVELKNLLPFAKTQNGREHAFSCDVDNFVAAKAFNFNQVQQTSTSRPQSIQQQSLRINKNP